MIRLFTTAFLFSIPFVHADGLKHQTLPNDNPDMTLSHFAYGACWRPTHSQKHWQPILANKPQLWLWLGDNIYGDSEDMDVLRKKYAQLAATEGYRKLAATCPVLATWDDHDYGANDAGSDFPKKVESQKLFLEFFDERPDSVRHQREGIYTSYYFGTADRRVQLILLDTRYFRSPLKRIEGKPAYRRMGKWIPDDSRAATMLGKAQWQWLEQELKKSARVRLIASSVQFSAPHHGHESWANMPKEKRRMIELIKTTRAEGVVFLSGDIHSSELCIEEAKGCYPLIDFTSSSLNIPLGASSIHRRIGPAFGGANFGIVNIDWQAADPVISISTKDTNNQTRLHHSVPLSKLTFAEKNLTPSATAADYAGAWQTFHGPLTLTKNAGAAWSGTCADRTLDLILENGLLKGSWKGKNRGGKVMFALTRDGQFLKGEYSDGDLPLQLDWAGWKADWEKHFTRDSYRPKKRKK